MWCQAGTCKKMREKGSQSRIEKRRHGTNSYQGIHVCGLLSGGLDCPDIKPATYPEYDWSCEHEKAIKHNLPGNRPEIRKPILHGTHEDDHTQNQSHAELNLKCLKFPFPGSLNRVFQSRPKHAQEFIPGIRNRLLQSLHTGPVQTVNYRCPSCCEIDSGILDTLNRL